MNLRLLVIVTALSLGSPRAGAAEPGPSGPRNRRVAVLPVRDFSGGAEDIWEGEGRKAGPDTRALRRYLVRRLSVEPNLDVLDAAKIRAAVDSRRLPREEARLGLERMSLGRSLYKNLQTKEAIPHLEQAEQALLSGYYDVLEPETVADLYLTLALCYLEEGQDHKTHVALKEMFFRSPIRRFKRGFYSHEFERALRSATTDFSATWPKEKPFGETGRLERFMRDLDVDSVIFSWIEVDKMGPAIRLVVLDRQSRSISYRAHFRSTSDAKDLERLDRFVSSWTTCLPPKVGILPPKKERVSVVYLDTSFAYNVFGSLLTGAGLTRKPFHNLGMGLSAEWQFLRGLGTFAQLNMLVSTRDPTGELTESFPSLRLMGGLSYAMRGSWWRISARFGVDAQFLLGDFTVARHRWCKWDLSHPRCDRNQRTTWSDEYMFGFHAAIGGQFFVRKPLYLSVRVGVSGYIIPSDRVDLDFPLGLDLGVGTSF